MVKIPDKKHSDRELNDLRKRNAFAVRPPVQAVVNLALHPILLAAVYLLTLTSAGLAIAALYIPALSCAGLSLLSSLVIFWKKPRSRHHAAFIAIISLLVLVFGSVYYLAQFEPTSNDPQGPIRY